MMLIALALCAAKPAAAQTMADYDYENLTFRGIGFDYGHIWPTKVEATSAYSVRLDLGFLGPGVRISPSITYWSSQFRQTEVERLATQINRLPALVAQGATVTAADLGTIKWSDLTIGLDAHLLWTTPVGIFTYVGAGVALHALNGQGTFVDKTFVEDLLDSTAAGISLMGGVEYQPVPAFRAYGEARYTMVSDVRYPGLRLGGMLMLPQRATPGRTQTTP
jgi:opacity protein-like surface antigen